MKTEAQKVRELLESLLKAGPIKLEDIYDEEEPEQTTEDHNMPDQRATYDQLLDMLELATQAGLYDAVDWLKKELRHIQASFK